MAFQTKAFATIVLGMINRAKALQSKITDFRVGSVARTLFESPAAEIDELYQQMWIGLKESIPVAIYNTFDFQRLPAQAATGQVRVIIAPTSGNTVIGAGSVFTAGGFSGSFTTVQDSVIRSGRSFVDCFVEATVPGNIGNVPGGASFAINPGVAGMVSAMSLVDFAYGSDLETDAERKTRFAAYILTLNRGTVAAIRYGLSLAVATDANGNVIERARHAQIIEPYVLDHTVPAGLVNCYIHNGVDGASVALVSNAAAVLYGYTNSNGVVVPGWKAAGVKVTVQAAANVIVNVSGTVTVAPGFVASDVINLVEVAIGEYIAGLNIGSAALRAELIAATMGVDGVDNFSLTLPALDIPVSNVQKAAIGAYTLVVV